MKQLLQRILTVLTLVSYLSGFSSAHAFTIGEEREAGEILLFKIRSAFQVVDEPDIYQYVNKLGEEVIDVAGVQFFDYHFFVIKDKEFNAFAAPSGLIFFHTGLIETMNSENELISVVSHEIGHIVKRHLASRLEKSKIVSIATYAVALASLALGSAEATQALLASSLAAGKSINLHFSRLDEEEADALAYRWMKQMGRSPEAQKSMLQTMRRITRYRMDQMPQYLLTHPNPEVRMDYVESYLYSDKQELPSLSKDDRFSFLRFKYRIMSMVNKGSSLREFLASKIADSHSDKTDILMAKYGISQIDRIENNYKRSLEVLKEVIDAFPQESILQVDKGVIEFESGKLSKSLITLTEAYRRDRGDLYAAFALANVHFRNNDLDKAEDLYLEVVESIPDYAKVYFELGRLKAQQNRNGDSSYYLGQYYLYQGKHRLSLGSFKNALKDPATDETLKKKAEQSLRVLERIRKG